jgi:hypothetical protein
MKFVVDFNIVIVIIDIVNWVDISVVKNMMEYIESLLCTGP